MIRRHNTNTINLVNYQYTNSNNSKITEYIVNDNFKHLTLCIGVQKAGTKSLKIELTHIPEMWFAPLELHYFDKDFEEFDSFNNAIDSFYKSGKNVSQFMDIILKSKLKNLKLLKYNVTEYIEKTPINILYPHIANIITNDMIKYGTKIFVLLRNPVKRFISGYFHEKRMLGDNVVGIDIYMDTYYRDNGNNSIQQFNNDIEYLYDKYIENNKDTKIFVEMIDRYNEFLYSFHKYSLNRFIYYIWIRGCYAAQILPWIIYIEQLNNDMIYKNSFKLIQSEKLFDSRTFSLTFNHLLCYINYHYDDNSDYIQWMSDCLNNKHNAKHWFPKVNSMVKSFQATKELTDSIEQSYSLCTDWLKVIIQDKYSHIILESFDWDLWTSV